MQSCNRLSKESVHRFIGPSENNDEPINEGSMDRGTDEPMDR
jgi:hypothetical protein